MPRLTTNDPRFQRARERLVRAVLDLAATRRSESIAVSELTAAAGVSRATFYGHAASPAALLADVLISDLRPDLDRLADQLEQPGADYVATWRQIYLTLLAQVAKHRAVYEIITGQESSVSAALTAYFEEAARAYVDSITARLDGPPVSELWTAMAVEQQAHNMLAVIRTWIVTGMADPPDVVVDNYLTLAPPWQLARADAEGRITLRRSRAVRAVQAESH